MTGPACQHQSSIYNRTARIAGATSGGAGLKSTDLLQSHDEPEELHMVSHELSQGETEELHHGVSNLRARVGSGAQPAPGRDRQACRHPDKRAGVRREKRAPVGFERGVTGLQDTRGTARTARREWGCSEATGSLLDCQHHFAALMVFRGAAVLRLLRRPGPGWGRQPRPAPKKHTLPEYLLRNAQDS
jgi:hypothetical protein